MKKKLFILICLILFFVSLKVKALTTVNETFEDGSESDYSPMIHSKYYGSTAIGVSTTEKHSGTYSLYTPNTDTRFNSLNISNTSDYDMNVSIWIYLANTGNGVIWVGVKQTAVLDNNYVDVLGIAYPDSNKMSYNDGSWHTSALTYSTGWHHFNFIYSAAQNKINASYYDGSVFEAGTAALTAFRGFYIQANKGAISYFDDISVDDYKSAGIVLDPPTITQDNPYTGTYLSNVTPRFWFQGTYLNRVDLIINGSRYGNTTTPANGVNTSILANASLTIGREYSWRFAYNGTDNITTSQTSNKTFFLAGEYPVLSGFSISNACYVTMVNNGYYIQR